LRISPFLLLPAFLVMGLVGTAAAAEPAFTPPAKAHFKIFLLVGQSNMAGRGKVEEEDLKPHPHVFKLDKQGTWVPAIDPLHYDKTVAGVGLGLTFGRAVAEAFPDDVIGLVPCAVGGTSIDQWSPAQEKGLYAEAIRRGKLATKDGTLAGILWHQGESDSKKADVYAEKAKTLFSRFRKDLDAPAVPVVIGTIGEFHPGGEAINAVLRALPDAVPGCRCADAAGLKDKGDKTHFDGASYRELGRRYTKAWVALVLTAKR
jgi:hypothetical protein